jgi:hypothetical protein
MAENDNQNNQDNREMVNQIQRFTASSISMINLLQTVCTRQEKEKLDHKENKAIERFMDSSQKFIDNIRSPEEDFDYTKSIKKAFNTLRDETQCKKLLEKNYEIFNLRDEDNKIVTIIPGLDIRVGYKFLDDNEKTLFWQYMYLFSGSVFNMIKISNEEKFGKYGYILETIKIMESELSKTGIMFNNKIFNPFIGVGQNQNEYSVTDMFNGSSELPKQQSVSIESVLTMLGVDKMFDQQKLNEELKGIGEPQINEATEKIIGLLGAKNNPEVKEVCGILIRDLVTNLKENGINEIGETLRKVAEKAKKDIPMAKMQKTASSMQNFMANSQEKMKEMKDANGNPIGQQMMNSMSIPLSMMNMMSKNAQNINLNPNQLNETNEIDFGQNSKINFDDASRMKAIQYDGESIRVEKKKSDSSNNLSSNRKNLKEN